jgi:glycosyltransferase involved in cell wall biosynthesis
MDSFERKNDFPLVSIITPSFNSYPYIIQNIESVKNQDYPNIEHIVIDGGSTDGTVEILKKYPHLKWISEKDSGQSEAINKGFRMAKGEIIGWLNSDDYYCEGAISFAVDFLKKNQEVDLIFSDEYLVGKEGTVFSIRKGEEVSFEKLIFKNVVRQASLFAHRKVIDEMRGVKEELHYVMDRDLWLRAIRRGFNFRYLNDKILANFRLCNGTKSNDMPISFKKEWIMVLEGEKKNPMNNKKQSDLIKKAIKETKCSLDFVIFAKELKNGRMLKALMYFFKGLLDNKKNVCKLSTWKLFLREIFYKINGKCC